MNLAKASFINKNISLNSMFDVISVGSAAVDVFADTESELIKIKSAESEEDLICYPVGSKLIVKDVIFKTGNKTGHV